MKHLLLALLLVASLSLAPADSVLKNSDFADGAQSWHGDGRPPSDFKNQGSLDTPVDYGDKGLVIQLKPHTWTKIIQEFKTKSATLTLNVTYKVAPGTTFSMKDDEYTNVPHAIGFDAWLPFNGKRGNFMTMVSDFAKSRIFFNNIAPKFDSTEEQTFKDTMNSLIPEDEKTLCLTFPPGNGAIILLHVSLDPQ